MTSEGLALSRAVERRLLGRKIRSHRFYSLLCKWSLVGAPMPTCHMSGVWNI